MPWKTVPVKGRPQRRAPAQAPPAGEAEAAAVEPQDSQDPMAGVTATAKAVRRRAKALADPLRPVAEAVGQLVAEGGPGTSVALYALGIGALDSDSAVLQAAFAVALANACAVAGPVRRGWFDPCQRPADAAIAERLGFAAVPNDHGGCTAATRPGDVVVAFLPRCPKAMYHNCIAAHFRGRRLVLLGNDVRDYADPTVVRGPKARPVAGNALTVLAPHMAFARVFGAGQRAMGHPALQAAALGLRDTRAAMQSVADVAVCTVPSSCDVDAVWAAAEKQHGAPPHVTDSADLA